MLRTALTIAAAWLIAGPALADEIHGCVRNSNGKLRIVGVQGACKPDRETPVTWNTDGPQGPAGAQGEQGPQGEPGPAPARFRLVGFSTASFDGGEGLLGFARACEAEFPGSRMCNTTEVAESTNVPDGLTGPAWVNLDRGSAVEQSMISDLCRAAALQGRWSTADSNFGGVVVNASGHVSTGNCNEFRSVACCAPAP